MKQNGEFVHRLRPVSVSVYSGELLLVILHDSLGNPEEDDPCDLIRRRLARHIQEEDSGSHHLVDSVHSLDRRLASLGLDMNDAHEKVRKHRFESILAKKLPIRKSHFLPVFFRMMINTFEFWNAFFFHFVSS